ncbi:MAG: universal stress protein [Sphingomonadales bacterium]
MQTILVATDFSTRSDRAMRRATLLAKQAGAKLFIVHVVDDDQSTPIVETERLAAEKLLEEQAKTIHQVDGLFCATRVILAAPFAGIAQAAVDAQADLLVIGPHRRQILRDAFAGTTAERSIRHASCPVLMVNATPVGAYRQALLTTDFSDCARAAAEAYYKLGIGADAKCGLLNVFEAPDLQHVLIHTLKEEERDRYLDKEAAKAQAELAEFRASLPFHSCQLLARFRGSTVANEVLNMAEQSAADLIVLGTQGRSGIKKLFLGSVAEEVLRYAQCDVLAVPNMA